MILRKWTALLLIAAMTLSLAACSPSNPLPESPSPSPTPTEQGPEEPSPTPLPTPKGDITDFSPVKEEDGTVYAGSVKAVLRPAGTGIGTDVYAGTDGKDYTDENTYTYNDCVADAGSLCWSPLTWKTADDFRMVEYQSTGLYGFELNSAKDGWSIICELAAALPEDVTADYVGSYGIEEGDKAMAWKIALNPDATWDDGTPINADTYLYSYRELLNPLLQDGRAADLFGEDIAIHNAEAYYLAGKSYWVPNYEGIRPSTSWHVKVKNEDGAYTTVDGKPIAFGLKTRYVVMDGFSLSDYHDAGYVSEETWKTLTAMADEDGYIPVTDESIAAMHAFIGSDIWGNEPESELVKYFSYQTRHPATEWDQVGIIKTGEYEFVLITEFPVANPEYTLPDFLSVPYLVKQDLWESCKKYYNADKKEVDKDSEEIASVVVKYGTGVDTTASYGPYVVTTFKADKPVVLSRNEQWFGYADGKHKGQYQTDSIVIQSMSKHDALLRAFRKGEIDSVTLQTDDMKEFGTSPYLRYTPQPYTVKVSFNSDREALEERGTQVLANENFRRAFSLAIDRAKFTSIFTSAGTPGFGLLNSMYVCDTSSGEAYRDTDGAKGALVGLYGVTFGKDAEYADLEAAYGSITGYDLEAAREYMKKAYAECIEDRTYDGSSKITITMSVYRADEIYEQMVLFLENALKAACETTGFEGKVSLKAVADTDFYNTMYAGKTDMIFSTVGGAASSPYSILYDCYCDDYAGGGQQLEYGFNTEKLNVHIVVDDVDYVAPLQQWALWTDGSDPAGRVISVDGTRELEQFSEYDIETQATIYGFLEKIYLSSFAAVPLYYRNSASLVSQKGDFAVSTYIDRIAFGGLRFYTYAYTDEEWKEAAGKLEYTVSMD